MYEFVWNDAVDDALLTSITSPIGISGPEVLAEMRGLLVDLLVASGGLPVSVEHIDSTELALIVRGVIGDAVREAFAMDLVCHETVGTHLTDSGVPEFDQLIEIGPLVCINHCSLSDLDDLPGIGPALAERIIAERHARGAFRGGLDLAERVRGIGDKKAEHLIRRLRFTRRPTFQPSPTTPAALLTHLVTRTAMGAVPGLRAVLEHTIAHAGARPQDRWHADRRYGTEIGVDVHDVQGVGVLRGSDYYYWMRDSINAASDMIRMAMFHIALPGTSHPSHDLVQAMIDAAARGVDVRILLDLDRPEDVYGSEVINSAAFELLRIGGVDVRFDQRERLLHSKFIALDTTTSVVGSHNWSAGSYFHYDDISLAIESEPFNTVLRDRFEQLWLNTSPGND